jgi:ADP-heptose:LPS heptosyltransferase
VGIVWAGSARPNPRRSCPLAALAPLFTLEGVSWYSLQVGDRAAELAREPAAAGIHNLAPALQDFADTAGAIAQLDLVVTIDTSVAHLAGALGTDVWVMLMAAPDWRWFFDREDSPWYPSARLFRQRRPGDWDSVVMSVRDALAVRTATAVRTR